MLRLPFIGRSLLRLSLLLTAAATLLVLAPHAHGQFPPGTMLNIENDSTIPIQDGPCELASEDGSLKTTIVSQGSTINIKAGAQIFIRRNGGIVANAQFSKGIIEVSENFSLNDVAVHRLIVYTNGTPKVKEVTIAGKPAGNAKHYYDGKNFLALNTPAPIGYLEPNKRYVNYRPFLYVLGAAVVAGLGLIAVVRKRRSANLKPANATS